MAIGIKKFNWVQRPTAFQYAEAWRSHRRNMVQRFIDEGASLSNVFVGVQTNLSSGMATLAAQASITRAQDEIRAAQAEFAKQGQLDLSL